MVGPRLGRLRERGDDRKRDPVHDLRAHLNLLGCHLVSDYVRHARWVGLYSPVVENYGLVAPKRLAKVEPR